jgi:hypothetical protein
VAREPIVLSFDRREVYEVGADLIVLLCCPNTISEELRKEYRLSLCARALRANYDFHPNDETPITAKPQYLFRKISLTNRHGGYISNRLGERMIAGRMMAPFLRRAQDGQTPTLPKGVSRLTVNQLSAWVLDDAELSDANDVEKRYWAPSRPVVHLAAAALVVGHELKNRQMPMTLESLVSSREWIREVIRLAEIAEKLIANDPQAPVKFETLVRVRLA